MSDAINSIKNEIKRRADEESKKIISNADGEAQKVLHAAKEKAERIRTETVKTEVTTMRKKIIGSAQLDGRKTIINAKEEALSKTFDKVNEKLIDIANRKDRKFKYEEILFKLIKEAVLKIDEKKILVAANKKDLSYISSNLSSIKRKLEKELGYKLELTIMKEPRYIIGGIIVYNVDKTKIFNNTLDGRLMGLKDSMRGDISKVLFE
ncbi:MAG: V-type ATP synthase subunit E family protein [Candidatus Bathyarchaeota archaeon]|nr:V-type ATP synthase subunit E family protein [Candidatus Bathyarchaeota archaeon]